VNGLNSDDLVQGTVAGLRKHDYVNSISGKYRYFLHWVSDRQFFKRTSFDGFK
jgi:hypothetical protein